MAYAAVISLKYTIERLDFPFNIREVTKSAYEKLNSLDSILRGLNAMRSRSIDRSVINELDAEIRDAVWKLEDVLESYRLSQGVDEQGVEREIDSFLKMSKKLCGEYKIALETSLLEEEEDIIDDAAAVSPINNNSTTVGFSDLSEQITSQLLSGMSKGKVVALVGMAGIGKTHLARDIYHHPLIVQHFHSRAWVSVGRKDKDSTNLLVDILTQIERKPRDVFEKKGSNTLVCLLQKTLSGGRHLIVLDDVWSLYVLYDCIDSLPDGKSESRFLVTTRQKEATSQFWWRSSIKKVHQMQFLNNEESWILLWQNVFADESNFPSQLEKAGKKIAEHCEGLPLLILAVADILRGLDKSQEYWNKVAEKKTNTFIDAYEQIYEVLLSSYHYLSQYLKPCFLYMGVFPQSHQILVSKLINLWTVEDFLEPSQWGSMETLPRECMEKFVSNSLAIVCKRSFERVRRTIYCKLHSVYWYLCVKEARKNKLFHVLNKLTDVSIERPRRLSVQNNALFGIKEVYDSIAAATSTTRSLLFTGADHQYPVHICFNMMLLMKVLDGLAIRFYEFPEEVLNLLQLRYLALTHYGELPSSISRLRQLEWLILSRHHNIKLMHRDSTSCLAEEIWDLQELRYLRIVGSNLPDPSEGKMLWKLLTLYVNADSCTEDVLRSIPNLKKLGIKIELHPDSGAETLKCLEHVEVLKKLESLKCVVVNPFKLAVAPPADHLSNLPGSLKKLSLNGFGYSWKYMSVIGSLRSLQVLKLRCSAFQGPEWKTKGGQFESLEFLLLEDIDLVHWINKKCFRCLHHLIVRHCYKLKKIPVSIGGIETLETMEVDDCSPSVVASAHQIKEKTKSSNLEVVINSSWNI